MTTPWVGTHMYLWHQPPDFNTENWDTIPDKWRKYRFDAVDYLFVSPFVVTNDEKGFGLATCNKGDRDKYGTLTKRFEWIVANARAQNPSVKIICMQWWNLPFDPDGKKQQDGNDFSALRKSKTEADPAAIDNYASSVAKFLHSYDNKTLKSDDSCWNNQKVQDVPAHLDGYDVDVEQGIYDQPGFIDIIVAIHKKLDGTGKTVSITPAWETALDNSSLAGNLDFLNMQRYDGGKGTTPKKYLQAITNSDTGNSTFNVTKLTYGFSTEVPSANAAGGTSLADILADFDAGYDDEHGKNQKYRGIWTWCLTSDNCVFENMAQVALYNHVHQKVPPNELPNLPTPQTNPSIDFWTKWWPTGGRDPWWF